MMWLLCHCVLKVVVELPVTNYRVDLLKVGHCHSIWGSWGCELCHTPEGSLALQSGVGLLLVLASMR
jgi:hypothetical protein